MWKNPVLVLGLAHTLTVALWGLVDTAGLGAFTEGATMAFLVGSLMMVGASALVWLLLDVKHEELATDEAPEGVHVG